jgi:hypothetical protein
MPVIFAPLYTLLDGAPVPLTFLPGEDVEPRVRDLAAVIGSVAIPFMHRFKSLDDFIEGMRARLATDSVDYDLPAALMLAGRKDEAEIELRRGLDKRVGIEGEWAESYRRFAEFLAPGIQATPGASPVAREPSWIRTSRVALGNDLRAYGETELAARSADLTEAEMLQIGVRAFAIATTPDPARAAGMLLAKALALATVEVIEGQSRDLHRRRRDLKAQS